MFPAISSASRPFGTSISEVRAEPPSCLRFMSISVWLFPPNLCKTFFAASSSTSCLCPYLNEMVYGSNPSALAMARAVVESSPPLKSTTAFLDSKAGISTQYLPLVFYDSHRVQDRKGPGPTRQSPYRPSPHMVPL